MSKRKKIIAAVIAILVVLIVAACAFVVVPMLQSQTTSDGSTAHNNVNNTAINSTNSNANEARGTYSETTSNINSNTNGNESTTNTNTNEVSTTSNTSSNKATQEYTHQSFPVEQAAENKQTMYTMDRDKMKTVATDFINAYYSKDYTTRRINLSNLLDVDFLQEQGTDSLLYMDYRYSQNQPQESLVSIDDVTINNAQSPNGSVRVRVTLEITMQLDDGGGIATQRYSGDVNVYINDNYKVTEIKKQFV